MRANLTNLTYDIALASNHKARVNPVVAACLLVLAGLPFVFLVTFIGIPDYDDEGTLMITFRQLFNGGILYHYTYALYGPFCYFLITLIFSLFKVPLSND